MNAPIIFVLIPILVGGLLILIPRRPLLSSLLASGVCLLLALLAGFLPMDQAIILGTSRITIASSLDILGRQIILNQESLGAVILIFAIGAFWFLGIRPASAPRRLAPIGMILMGLAVATMAVRPFLYSAIILEVFVLVSVPLFVPSGQAPGNGVLRYIIFMSLALPFVLLAGAMAGQVEQSSIGNNLILFAVILLLLGFAFWLAVFPLNTWVPMLSEEAHPFVIGFVLSILSTIVLLMLRTFMNEFTWLGNYPDLPIFLKVSGVVMVASAGILAAFQTDMTRLMGYSVILENGLVLLMLSLPSPEGQPLFAASLPARLLGIAVMVLALASLRKSGLELTMDGLRGAIFKKPGQVLSLICGYFSLAGFPLLAGFPIRLVLFERLAETSLDLLVWVGVGVAGFILTGLRLVFSVSSSDAPHWQIEEDRLLVVMLSFGVLLLILIGLFPSVFLNWFATRL
jgi:formate hydrogenlyase subunit 3/multisubunit Na+/H+ antiporter MnhD subunit